MQKEKMKKIWHLIEDKAKPKRHQVYNGQLARIQFEKDLETEEEKNNKKPSNITQKMVVEWIGKETMGEYNGKANHEREN